MTRDKVISKLLNDDVETVREWAIQGCFEELYGFLADVLEYHKLSDEELLEQAEGRGLI